MSIHYQSRVEGNLLKVKAWGSDDNLDEVKMVQIVNGQAFVAEGEIRHNSPIARTLLGAFVGETVTAPLPTGSKEIRILEIVKS